MRLMAIDPGTTICGVALFDGPELERVAVIKSTYNKNILTRINGIMFQLEHLREQWKPAEVACETWGGDRNPTGQTFIHIIKQTCKEWKTPFHPCNSTAVVAKIRKDAKLDPKRFPMKKTSERKTIMYTGVLKLYPGMEGQENQDAFDAVAIGHYYLSEIIHKAREGV